ncbi:hypothetical protein V9T40_010351 [Parthenolecanium corni]|uniref:Uncharacterized protein n=1 Tax=Parthenolecanium corni TaxID=536013 RepID=A0AAN9TAA7_9HEMI
MMKASTTTFSTHLFLLQSCKQITKLAKLSEIDTSKDDQRFYLGVLFLATGYLTLVCKTLANIKGKPYEEFPVIIENVQFLRATIIPKDGDVRFAINIFDGREVLSLKEPDVIQNGLPLTTSDIYNELGLREYDYSEIHIFRGIKTTNNSAVSGNLESNGNFVSFMDTIVVIDPAKQKQIADALPERSVPVFNYQDTGIVVSGGVEMRGLKASLAPRRQQQQALPKLEKYYFIPFDRGKVSKDPVRLSENF